MPITVSHVKSNTIADFTGTITVYNSAGAATTMEATNQVRPVDWNSVHAVTLSVGASELPSVSYFEPFPLPNTNSTLSAPGIGTWYLQPFNLPHGLSSGQIRMPVSNAAGFLLGRTYSATSTGSISWQQSLIHGLALYSLGTGASSSRLETIWTSQISYIFSWSVNVTGTVSNALTVTNALTMSFPSQYDVAGSVTYGTVTTSGTRSSGASTAPSSFADSLITGVVARVSGARLDFLPLNVNIPPGAYWMGHMFSSSSASAGTRYTIATLMSTQSRLGLLDNLMNAYHPVSATVSNSSSGPQPFVGYLATTTISASSIIGTVDVRYTTGRAYWNYFRSSH